MYAYLAGYVHVLARVLGAHYWEQLSVSMVVEVRSAR